MSEQNGGWHTLALIVGVHCLGLAEVAGGATLRVPSEFATINAGLDAAAGGDTVLVAPGTYTEYEVRGNRTACAFLKAGVVLRSEDGPLVTTIDMEGQGTAQPNVLVGVSLDDEVKVEGFSITGVPFRAGVFLFECAKVTLRSCVLRDLDAAGVGTAGGVWANQTDLDIIGCEFINCQGPLGGAIFQSDAALEVVGSLFRACATGVIRVSQESGPVGQARVRESTFVENVGQNGSIVSSAYGEVVIEACHFEGNVAQEFGGVAVSIFAGATRIVRDCVFLNNHLQAPGASGGAIALAAGGPGGIVEGNTFYGNGQTGASGGASIFFSSGGWLLRNNVVANSSGAAAILDLNASVVSSCNVFWANGAGNGNGYELGSTDQEVDPMFCDPENGDLTVSETSPCLPENAGACGQIGALGLGCGAVSVEKRSWGSVKSGYRRE